MKSFNYSLPARLILKYGFIPLSLIMIIYALASAIGIFEKWFYVFPFAIHLLLLYVIIRFFIKIKKYFPFKIELDSEKIVCSEFLGRKDVVTIKLSEIDEIKGGLFSGNNGRPIYIICSEKNLQIGVYRHLSDYNEFLKLILSNVPQNLYNELMQKMEKMAEGYRKRKSKK